MAFLAVVRNEKLEFVGGLLVLDVDDDEFGFVFVDVDPELDDDDEVGYMFAPPFKLELFD